MIERALRYQTEGDDWLKRVAIGGGVVFLANLVFLPLFTVYGYMLEVMRRNLDGDTETPPEWEEFDIVDVSIDGAKAFAILFAYTTAVGLVILIPSGVLLLLSAVLRSGILGFLAIVVGGVLSLVGALLIAIIAPVAIGNFAITDDIMAGFDIGVLRRLGTNRKMLRAAVFAIGVSLLISVVSSVLFFTIVGPALVTFVGFSAITVIWASGFGDAYREIYGELPEIPDGPMKPSTTHTGATTADADTTTATDAAGADEAAEHDEAPGEDPADSEDAADGDEESADSDDETRQE